MRALAIALTFLAAGLAGCSASYGNLRTECDEAYQRMLEFPGDHDLVLASDPRQPWDTVNLFPNPEPITEYDVRASDEWQAAWTTFEAEEPAGTFASLRLTPMANPPATGGARLEWEARPLPTTPCEHPVFGTHEWTLRDPQEGEVAAAGQGVHVYTAGFWENGTLFYTNIQALEDFAAWPRAGWYAWEGGDPLRVYVYDDGTPNPYFPIWNPNPPVPGAPREEQNPYQYYRTIEGFNEALVGLSSTTARVVHIPAEKAYTVEGNEASALYGHDLVFWIRVVDVVDVPCVDRSLDGAACDALPG